MNPVPKVPCPKCVGTGSIPLPKPLQETLRALGRDRLTPQQVHERIKGHLGVTAVCNRLKQLRGAGFVGREQRGRGWVYFKTPNK